MIYIELVAAMKMIYAGAGQHYLLSASKVDSLYRLSQTDNRRLAEWALSRIEFEESLQSSIIQVEGQPLYSYLPKLHHDYEQDLKQNYFINPPMSDSEAVDAIFHDAIEREFRDLDKEETIVIHCC